ncbi:MAG TPA: efflux RND transporter periplasmic adaptor subunit [Rhodothermales bacterium]|nr:efflux RND transporter periplasmic adaptor subunit [Rhodothermales bacterium]
MLRSRRFLTLLSTPVVVLSLACSDAQEGDRRSDAGRNVSAVEVVKAQYGSLPLRYRLSGIVRSANQVAIYPEISANVVSVPVQTGEKVRAGDPLVYLRDTQLQEQVQQAEAALDVARGEQRRAEANLRELESRLDRTRQLAAQRFQSEQELESLVAQVDAASASLEQATARVAQAAALLNERREEFGRTVVRAPISGNVGRRNVEVGMRVDQGTQLFMIGSLDLMQVEVSVPDEMAGRIQRGQTALIGSPALGDSTIYAQVSRISPFLQPGSFSAAAEIDVPNSGGLLLPGMFVTVDVLYGESEQATLVPTSALWEDPSTGVLGVVVAQSLGTEIPVEEPESFDEEAPPPLLAATPMVFQPVEVLARGGDAVGIAGAAPDTWVVVVGQHLLDGIANERISARARMVPWARISSLQDLQDEDLLRQFMAKQQQMSKQTLGTEAEPVDSTASPAGGASASD